MDSLGNCSVCGKEAVAVYPLLVGVPAFCGTHHNPKDAGPFGCDFTGPDDFDIPFDDEDVPFHIQTRRLDRKTFVWTDKEGKRHKLKDIDDVYLTNIINFLERKIAIMGKIVSVSWIMVRSFLLEEAKRRDIEVFCG